MTPERRRRVEEIVVSALALESSERAAYLDVTCTQDAELRREVEPRLPDCPEGTRRRVIAYCNGGVASTSVLFTLSMLGYPNWAAFVAAHPTWHVGATPFVIADDAGLWTVSNVHLGEQQAARGNKNDCKKGGWMDLERKDGSSFKNQGDCIQYMNTGK